MKRFSVRVALGLTALLIAPSVTTAQVGSGAAKSREGQPLRGFRGVSFGAPTTRIRPGVSWQPLVVNPLLGPEGTRLPSVTAAPQPHPTPPPCVMPVIPIDPKFSSRMLVVNGDDSIDPKSVIKLPPCQPKR